MVEDESDRLQEKPVVKAKIVEKGAHYDAYVPEDVEAEPAPMVWNPPVAEEPEEPEEPEIEEPPLRQQRQRTNAQVSARTGGVGTASSSLQPKRSR